MSASAPAQGCAEALPQLYLSALDAAQQALARNDDESLHDFRVALRRLRVTVENYAEEGMSTRRVLATLDKLLKRSNRARDGEVMLAWLRHVKPQLAEAALAGARCWQRSLPPPPRTSSRSLQRNRIRLERLKAGLIKLPPRQAFVAISFSLSAAQRLALHVAVMQKLLQQEVAVAALHQLRLEVKALRYLLLPFCATVALCGDAENGLQQLQDKLGAWHDAVMRRESLTRLLARRVVRLPARVARALRRGKSVEVNTLLPELTGLTTIASLSRADEEQLLDAIVSGFMHTACEPLVASLERCIAVLRQLSAD